VDVASVAASLRSDTPAMPTAAEVREAEELDVSYVRSKGTSVLFGPLVKCAQLLVDASCLSKLA
jgi:hypothetical protein